MTQAALAEAAHVRRELVSRIEGGAHPAERTYRKITAALGFTIATELFDAAARAEASHD